MDALGALAVLSHDQLVRAWMETPALIFPRRRIGKLEDGYEATFLVFRENPLVSLESLRTITHRVKQGCAIQ